VCVCVIIIITLLLLVTLPAISNTDNGVYVNVNLTPKTQSAASNLTQYQTNLQSSNYEILQKLY